MIQKMQPSEDEISKNYRHHLGNSSCHLARFCADALTGVHIRDFGFLVHMSKNDAIEYDISYHWYVHLWKDNPV